MKLTTGILAMAMMAGGSWAAVAAQNPDAIDNARSVAKSLQQKQANDTNAALEAAGVPAQAKPVPGSPAPAVKPAVIPGSKPVSVVPAKKSVSVAPEKKPASVSAPGTGSHNQLSRVNVVPGADGVRVEISSSRAVTPRLSKLDKPARVVVELPDTVMATAQSRIAVSSDGVKGVRIGMDGKSSPTTSVVIDLDKACSYELSPGSAEKLVLTLHTQAANTNTATAKPTVITPAPAVKAAVKPAAPVVQSKAESKVQSKAITAPVVKSAPVVAGAQKPATPTVKASTAAAKPQVEAKPAVAAKATVSVTPFAAKPGAVASKQPAVKEVKAAAPVVVKPSPEIRKTAEAPKQPKPEEKKWAMSGKRDPFFSPVVQQSGGSGCSTGKKCLEIGAINLRGVVKSDNGFIAVVTNNLNKAYFLRENDPVFNGYVVKITGDSVVFQETVQDKLGKSFTREVVKRLFTPAV